MKDIVFNLDGNKKLSLFNSDVRIVKGDKNAFEIRLETAKEWKNLVPWIRIVYYDTVTKTNENYTAPMLDFAFDLHNGFTQGTNILVSFALYDGNSVEAYTDPISIKILDSALYDEGLTPQEVSSILQEVSTALHKIEEVSSALAGYVETSCIGMPNGVAPLDNEGLVPVAMMPDLFTPFLESEG